MVIISFHKESKPITVELMLMPKILHILSQKPGNTGSGVFLHNLVREGFKRGIDQSVIAGFTSEDEIPRYLSIPRSSVFPIMFESEILPFSVAGMSDEMPYKSTRFSTFDKDLLEKYIKAFSEVFQEAYSKSRPDFIWSHHLWIATSLARRMFPGTPVLTFCHGTELRQMKLAPFLKSYVVEGCKDIDAVLALTGDQKNRIVAEYGIQPDKIIISGTGICEDIFHPDTDIKSKDEKTTIITYAGKLCNAKGVPLLIEAFGKITARKPGLQLILAGGGSGEETDVIIKKGKAHGESVVFAGKLTPIELAELFRKSAVMVLPSFFEGLPLVIFEALACGCRIVATDLPGVREAVPETFIKNGIVSLIPLPTMKTIDVPVESSLPDFVDNLEKAVFEQIEAVEKAGKGNEYAEFIRERFSWRSLFDRVYSLSQKKSSGR
jgi:glycosyltransferase involved in cell wall biosynthesis